MSKLSLSVAPGSTRNANSGEMWAGNQWAKGAPFEVRFWATVDRSGGPDACWSWLGTRQTRRAGAPRRYGSFVLAGRKHYAHRHVLELTLGRPLAQGECALHHCDNPGCINPAHLFVGTVADNQADMARKGRSPRGEANPSAKLTAADVLEIRSRYGAGGITRPPLAREFGVSVSCIQGIVERRTWAWLPDEVAA